MDVTYPKFIIEETETGKELYIGRVTFHKQLKNPNSSDENVLGGGWWVLKDNVFILSDESQDFGQATIEDINDCIKNKKVFTNYTGNKNLTSEYSFQYKDTYTREVTEFPFD